MTMTMTIVVRVRVNGLCEVAGRGRCVSGVTHKICMGNIVRRYRAVRWVHVKHLIYR